MNFPNRTRLLRSAFLVPCMLVAAVLTVSADDKKDPPEKKDGDGVLTVIDAKGKEQKVKGWQFTAGTRHLGFLTPARKEEPKEKEPSTKPQPTRRPVPTAEGPEALVFRDENSTLLVKGVETLIPLDRIRSIEYDAEKKTATVKVATSDKPDDDVSLTGTTKFANVNKLTIEAEVDKGELGVASVKYFGGTPTGIKAVKFPSPKGGETPKGRPALVSVNDEGKKTVEKVTELHALYRTNAGELQSPILFFKKTVKIDVAKIAKLKSVDDRNNDWEVTLKDGNEENFSMLPTAELDGKPVAFQGFLAKSAAGWKLFNPGTVSEIQFDEMKEGPKPAGPRADTE